jgi:uncharacterized protein YdhG (YjbR/CyaY superfamily)
MMRMKKGKVSARGAAAKPKAVAKNTDEYLAAVPEPARSTLIKIRAAIWSVVPPEATETISYGIPAFKYKGTLVWFAAFKKHCSFFPMNSLVSAEFKNELKNLHVSKGTLRFPLDKPLSAALVKELVRARIAQNERKRLS